MASRFAFVLAIALLVGAGSAQADGYPKGGPRAGCRAAVGPGSTWALTPATGGELSFRQPRGPASPRRSRSPEASAACKPATTIRSHATGSSASSRTSGWEAYPAARCSGFPPPELRARPTSAAPSGRASATSWTISAAVQHGRHRLGLEHGRAAVSRCSAAGRGLRRSPDAIRSGNLHLGFALGNGVEWAIGRSSASRPSTSSST